MAGLACLPLGSAASALLITDDLGRIIQSRDLQGERRSAILPVPLGEPEQPERNGMLSHGTGFPAVTFPGGFSAPTRDAPLGVPIGAELLGADFSEPRLLALAHAFEQSARIRRPPPSTPAL